MVVRRDEVKKRGGQETQSVAETRTLPIYSSYVAFDLLEKQGNNPNPMDHP